MHAPTREQHRVLGRLQRTIRLVLILAPREIRIRYRQSVLDVAWALIGPVTTAVVYGVVLTRSFNVTAACGTYVTSAWAGLVMWTFFATAIGSAVGSITGAAHLVTKVYFPKESLPLSMTAAAGVDLLIGVVTLAVLMAVFVRDAIHATALVLRVGFFATPVMFEATQLPHVLSWTRTISPPAVAIEGVRTALLCGHVPDVRLLGLHLLVGFIALAATIWLTASRECRIADVV